MDYLVVRFFSALLAGTILSQTGSLIQISTRNILASPSTLGFDGLSIFWILIFHSLLLFFGLEDSSLTLVLAGLPLFIITGLIYSSFIKRYQSIEKLILMGLTFNLFVGAVFSLWQFLFLAFNLPFPVELWFGHFRYSNSDALLLLSLLEIVFIIFWFTLRNEFNVFSLGKTVSTNLKLKQNRLYLFIFVSISIGTFTVISLFGAFSFLGLVFPILARKLWFKRFDLKGEFLLGAFVNGLFLMFIDILCYYFPIYGAEVPVGLIATGVGAVSLILLLWKSDNRLEILAKTQK
ncbi:MAG: iron chelate uptake ABC transporter family permease subunit [Bacteriovoracia bacterium]